MLKGTPAASFIVAGVNFNGRYSGALLLKSANGLDKTKREEKDIRKVCCGFYQSLKPAEVSCSRETCQQTANSDRIYHGTWFEVQW